MAIEKLDVKTINVQENPYTQICTSVIQNIKDPLALAIYVYLLSKPSNWVVIKSYLEETHGIGERKMREIFSYFHRAGLIEYIQERDEKGKILSFSITVLNGLKFDENEPFLAINSTKAKIACVVKNPVGQKPTQLQNHTGGKDALQRIDNNKGDIKEKKREVSLSEFIPNERSQALCKERNIDVHLLYDKFMTVKMTEGFQDAVKNWDAIFQSWIINERR